MTDDIIRQQHWSEDDLKKSGFDHYERKKELVMCRELPAAEAPKRMWTSDGQELVAKAGSMICYVPGGEVLSTLDSYHHWPVEQSIFEKTYLPWDEPNWIPSPPEKHLIGLGCAPYYKSAGIWAKEVEKDVYLQSLEHEEPVLTKTGSFIAIGVDGEPYTMRRETFENRYKTEQIKLDEISRDSENTPPASENTEDD